MGQRIIPLISLLFILSPLPQGYAADEDQWYDFEWQEAGLTQSEFQAVKASQITKEKLLYLIEIGISPSLYLQKTWQKLGVTEEHWLQERSAGMEDGDIDRTLDQTDRGRIDAGISFLLPSWYQWKSRQPWKAMAINCWTAATVFPAIWLTTQSDPHAKWFWLSSLVANFYSLIDGLADNPRRSDHNARDFAWAPWSGRDGSLGLWASYKF